MMPNPDTLFQMPVEAKTQPGTDHKRLTEFNPIKPFVGTNSQWESELRRHHLSHEWWMVDKLLRGGTIHLVSGPSGVGKTTWILQQLYEWHHGRNFMDKYTSYPCKWVFVSCDRDIMDTELTLRRIGIKNSETWQPHIYGINNVYDIARYGYDIHAILNSFPDASVFIIEGIQSLMPNTSRGESQNKVEMQWAAALKARLLNEDKCIIGITHPPKVRQTGSVRSRTDSIGSVSFSASCGTIFTVDYATSPLAKDSELDDEADDMRVVSVSGHDFKGFRALYQVDKDGKFTPAVLNGAPATMQDIIDHTRRVTAAQANLDAWLLGSISLEREFGTKDVCEAAAKINLSIASARKWIGTALSRGLIERVYHGVYKRKLGGNLQMINSSDSDLLAEEEKGFDIGAALGAAMNR